MAGIYVNVEGLDEIANAFGELGDKATAYAQEAANKAGEIILKKAKAEIKPSNKDKQHIRDNLIIRKAKKNKSVIYSTVGIKSGFEYGVPLELGHKLVREGKEVGTVAEKPFLRPATDKSKDEIVNLMIDALNKAIEDFGGK